MPFRWKLFRLLCILQLSAAAYYTFRSLIQLFITPSFIKLIPLIVFMSIIALTMVGINLLQSNYPDTPVEGKTKKIFNRVFLVNFIFLAFLFSFVIAQYRLAKFYSEKLGLGIFELPTVAYSTFLIYVLMLIFQFLLLYGLFVLRAELYANFRKQQFEFEKQD